jgi:hypothetical protein
MNRRLISRSLAFAVIAAFPLAAQQKTAPAPTFDRRAVPPAGKDAELVVPTWTKTTLANGATLVVSERHSLPSCRCA